MNILAYDSKIWFTYTIDKLFNVLQKMYYIR